MENLINVFMNYKINRLTEYAVLIYGEDFPFLRQVFEGYFRTYVDNYYYGIFNTIDDEHFNLKNLRAEFDGMAVEMLEDYKIYELQVSNEEYDLHCKLIRDVIPLCVEISRIDTLKYKNRDDISPVLSEFVGSNSLLSKEIDKKLPKLTSLVRETYQTCQKLLNYEDSYYVLSEKKFLDQKEMSFVVLDPNIKVLEVYRKAMIYKVYREKKFDLSKMECLIQKVSLSILKTFLNHKEIDSIFIELPDSIVSRGKIHDKMLALMDNPMFRKYVVISVHYNTYLDHKEAFFEDYHFACMQDFSHINDVYQKTDNIYKEGIFQYLIVEDCKYKDRDFFINYNSDTMKTLLFEEEE